MAQGLPTKGPITRGATLRKAGAGVAAPFAATTQVIADNLALAKIAGGLVFEIGKLAPTLTVSEATSEGGEGEGEADTHAWLEVKWDATYTPTSAVVKFGTEWPSVVAAPAAGETLGYAHIPLAYIDTGALVQIRADHVTLHVVYTTTGVLLLPAA